MSKLERIREAGIVGMGGAGFPTYNKFTNAFKHLIVNAVECEPLLRTDRYVVRRHADTLVKALEGILAETGAETATIALKKTYEAEIQVLREALACSAVKLKLVDSYYPAGDEQSLVYEVLGKVVPPLNIPLALGAVVMNVSTLLASAEAFDHKPLTHRYLTVAGAVNSPCVVYAPIGTSFAACIDAAGGIDGSLDDMCIVAGGPMMGQRHPDGDPRDLFVGKTTSGILVLPKSNYRSRPLELEKIRQTARAACIQCVYCTELCPRHLLGHPLEPHRIMRLLAYNELEDVLDHPTIQSAQLCCECGICETYACPMQLKPRDVNALIKKELQKANVRLPQEKVSPAPHPMREYRKVETRRAAARVGVAPYYNWEYDRHRVVMPETLTVALRQGLGSPSVPVVEVGSVVTAGELIAQCPEGKLGADLHAPMTGAVTEISEHIVIAR